jgi:hypothetical protein
VQATGSTGGFDLFATLAITITALVVSTIVGIQLI